MKLQTSFSNCLNLYIKLQQIITCFPNSHFISNRQNTFTISYSVQGFKGARGSPGIKGRPAAPITIEGQKGDKGQRGPRGSDGYPCTLDIHAQIGPQGPQGPVVSLNN